VKATAGETDSLGFKVPCKKTKKKKTNAKPKQSNHEKNEKRETQQTGKLLAKRSFCATRKIIKTTTTKTDN
jgi:hypothetical protein